MFLRKTGASGRFSFDEIYSCFQKSLRRGYLELALEMVKEFKDYPNALKKRLVYCCCEDCPNLFMIRDIYNTPADIKQLVKFVPIICNHIKCREVIMTFRTACQADYISEDFDWEHDDVWIACRKLFFKLCQTNHDVNSIISDIQSKCDKLRDVKQWKLTTISNFIHKCRTVLYAIIAFNCIPYITVENYVQTFNSPYSISEAEIDNLLKFKYDHKFDKLPNWVYDKHCHNSPSEQRTYEFSCSHLLLIPTMPETPREALGKKLYIKTNMPSGAFIKYVKQPKTQHNPGLQIAQEVLTPEEFSLLIDNVNTGSVNSNSTVSNNNDINVSISSSNNSISSSSNNELNVISQVQVQCITSRHKPRTWFIKLKPGKSYTHILKGPMRPPSNEAAELILSDKIKSMLGLVSPKSRLVDYRAEKYLLSLNMADIQDPIKTITRTTKLETNVEVFDGNLNILNDKQILNYSLPIQAEILKLLFFRKLIGTNDTTARNFIVNLNKNICCSIDDPVKMVAENGFMFKKQFNHNLKLQWEQSLANTWDIVYEFICNCSDIVLAKQRTLGKQLTDYMLDVCDEYSDIENWHF